MAGCTAVIHLAFAVMRGKLSEAEQKANNVEGTLKVFADASQNGITKVINLSSVSVYGHGRDLDETTPLRPADVFVYAQHKAEIEKMAAQHFSNVVHLRSHLIFGRHAQEFLRDMTNAPILIMPPAPLPVLQVVHEADVADAVMRCLDKEVSGVFNLAAPQIVSLPDLIRHQRKWVLPLPLGWVKCLASLAMRFGSKEEFTWLSLIDTTLTVNCSRAERLLGWTPRYSAWDARAEMMPSLTSHSH
jgi:nucleoside-diphosphate-sugar epimerase